jgi:glyoxylase-like metal-dependent hydrolase (beta-lactamase superfamily II)
VIDPLRDIDEYINLAKTRNISIKYIFETHLHTDFVSGHIDLSHKTGGAIVYGPGTKTNYRVYVASDGERFIIGDISIEVLHNPGHTLESSCFLLRDGSVGSPKIRPPQFRVNNRFVNFKFYNYAKKIYGKPDCICA